MRRAGCPCPCPALIEASSVPNFQRRFLFRDRCPHTHTFGSHFGAAGLLGQ